MSVDFCIDCVCVCVVIIFPPQPNIIEKYQSMQVLAPCRLELNYHLIGVGRIQ